MMGVPDVALHFEQVLLANRIGLEKRLYRFSMMTLYSFSCTSR